MKTNPYSKIDILTGPRQFGKVALTKQLHDLPERGIEEIPETKLTKDFKQLIIDRKNLSKTHSIIVLGCIFTLHDLFVKARAPKLDNLDATTPQFTCF